MLVSEKKKTLHRAQIESFLRKDLMENESQANWDWEADLRFAEFIGDAEAVKDISRGLRSNNLLDVVQWHAFWKKKITQKRLHHLNNMVKSGLVRAMWVGSGPCGKSDLGVSRIRTYSLRG